MKSFIELKNVKKTYIVGEQKFNALDGIDLSINQGEFVVILGPSGAGKSTLLNLLGGMDSATSGDIYIGEDNIAKFNDKELTRYRANDVGFIFQFYNVMPTLTVEENINLIKDVTNTSKNSKEVLESVGLLMHANKFPQELSGGEQQRVSIARAIMKNAPILILDDSTSAVDTATDAKIRQAFREYLPGVTKLIIAQRLSSIEDADKIIVMDKGMINAFDTHENLLKNNEIYSEVYESQVNGSGDFDKIGGDE